VVGALGDSIPPERVGRIIRAVLENVENWEERIREIEAHAVPGNKIRALSLLRDMEQCRLSLARLAGGAD
jgi:hypothetical protein